VTAAPDPNFAVGVLVALVIDLVYPVVHVVSAAGFVVCSLACCFHISYKIVILIISEWTFFLRTDFETEIMLTAIFLLAYPTQFELPSPSHLHLTSR